MPHTGRVPRHLEPHPPRLGRVVLALLVMAAAMLLIAVVGKEIVLRAGAVRRLDERVIDATTGATLAHPGLERVALVWGTITQPWVLFTLLAVVAAVLALTGLVRRRALWVVPVGLVGWGLSITCKHIVGRPRPVPDEAVTHADGYSYPSGHATGSTVALILLVVLLWPVVRSLVGRVLLVGGAVVVVVLTCLDRVYLGVHYPSDVLAGVLVGSAMTTAALAIGLRVRDGDVRPPQSRSA